MNTKAFIMLMLLAASALGAIVKSYVDPDGTPIDHHLGSYLIKDRNDALYRVTYDVHMLGGNLIINLDERASINKVTCDISNIELVIEFTNPNEAMAFYRTINSQATARFVTGSRWNCSDAQDNSMMLMRRVLKATVNQRVVILGTAQGYYEESIKDGRVTLDRVELPAEHSKTFCLGVNTQGDCNTATSPIPLYSNKYISLTCSNCFVGAKATVFLDLDISYFKLRRIASGLRDISVNAAFVMDLTAQGSWSAGFDKTYKIVDHRVIIQFWIGPIPVTIWYDIPLQVIANAKIDAQMQATAGAKATWKIGDAFVSWDENNGWKMAKPNPSFTWEPVFKVTGNFNAEAGLSIIPSFVIHCMRMLQAGVKMTPAMMFEAHGDIEKKEVCADLSYKVNSEASAEIHINIPLIKIRYDKVFGPYSLFDTGVKPIGHWCKKW